VKILTRTHRVRELKELAHSFHNQLEELAPSLIAATQDPNILFGGMTEWQGTALEKRQARKGLGVRIPVPPPEFANANASHSSEFSLRENV
jgi:hypothetical protein